MRSGLTEALRSAEVGEETAHLLRRADLLGRALALRASAVAMRDGPHTAAPIAERALRRINPYGRAAVGSGRDRARSDPS